MVRIHPTTLLVVALALLLAGVATGYLLPRPGAALPVLSPAGAPGVTAGKKGEILPCGHAWLYDMGGGGEMRHSFCVQGHDWVFMHNRWNEGLMSGTRPENTMPGLNAPRPAP